MTKRLTAILAILASSLFSACAGQKRQVPRTPAPFRVAAWQGILDVGPETEFNSGLYHLRNNLHQEIVSELARKTQCPATVRLKPWPWPKVKLSGDWEVKNILAWGLEKRKDYFLLVSAGKHLPNPKDRNRCSENEKVFINYKMINPITDHDLHADAQILTNQMFRFFAQQLAKKAK